MVEDNCSKYFFTHKMRLKLPSCHLHIMDQVVMQNDLD